MCTASHCSIIVLDLVSDQFLMPELSSRVVLISEP